MRWSGISIVMALLVGPGAADTAFVPLDHGPVARANLEIVSVKPLCRWGWRYSYQYRRCVLRYLPSQPD